MKPVKAARDYFDQRIFWSQLYNSHNRVRALAIALSRDRVEIGFHEASKLVDHRIFCAQISHSGVRELAVAIARNRMEIGGP